jgi:hypothetical protein
MLVIGVLVTTEKRWSKQQRKLLASCAAVVALALFGGEIWTWKSALALSFADPPYTALDFRCSRAIDCLRRKSECS